MESKRDFLIEQFFNTTGQMRRFFDHALNVSREERTATFLQMHALTFIKTRRTVTVGELADELGMSSSSVAQFVERLHDDTLVKRVHDHVDRRVVRISLTAKGIKHLAATYAKMKKKLHNIADLLPEKDLEELVRIHKDLLQKLEEKFKTI